MKAAARVIYRADWETDRPMIMEKYNWEMCKSEVLISTPRRFGKTFSWVFAPRKKTRRAPASRPSSRAPSRPRTGLPSSAPAWPFPLASRLWSSVRHAPLKLGLASV